MVQQLMTINRKKLNKERGFFVFTDEGFKEVKGSSILESQFPSLDLFVHRQLDGRNWAVTEGTTGLAIAEGGTRKEAVINAEERIKSRGINDRQDRIAQIEQRARETLESPSNLSPRYKGGNKMGKARIRVISTKFRGEQGFSIRGTDSRGRSVRIFTPSKEKAEEIRAAIGRHFIRKGGSVSHLQRIMGHSDVSTTMIYVFLNDQDIQEQQHEYSPIAGLFDSVEGS